MHVLRSIISNHSFTQKKLLMVLNRMNGLQQVYFVILKYVTTLPNQYLFTNISDYSVRFILIQNKINEKLLKKQIGKSDSVIQKY